VELLGSEEGLCYVAVLHSLVIVLLPTFIPSLMLSWVLFGLSWHTGTVFTAGVLY